MFDEIICVINFNKLILVLPNNSSHSTLNRVKCNKQILLSGEFERTTPVIATSVLPLEEIDQHRG